MHRQLVLHVEKMPDTDGHWYVKCRRYTLKRTVEKTSTLVANMSTVNVLFWLAYTTVDFVLQKMLNYNATLAVDVCLHLCGV